MLDLRDFRSSKSFEMSSKEFPRWQWNEVEAKKFSSFYDLKSGWFDLGPVGSGRVQDAWRSGAKPGTTFFLTTSCMVAVKVTLLAILPHGVLFARTTNPSIWMACRQKVNNAEPRLIITMETERLEDGWKVSFNNLAGVTMATAEVANGSTLEDAILKVDSEMPKGPIRLLFDVTEITPRNVRSQLGHPIMDSWDEAPRPGCLGGMGLDETLTRQMKELKKRIEKDGSYLPTEEGKEGKKKKNQSKPVKKQAGERKGDHQGKSTKTNKKVQSLQKKPAKKGGHQDKSTKSHKKVQKTLKKPAKK